MRAKPGRGMRDRAWLAIAKADACVPKLRGAIPRLALQVMDLRRHGSRPPEMTACASAVTSGTSSATGGATDSIVGSAVVKFMPAIAK